MMVLCILLAMLSLFLSLKLIYQRKLVQKVKKQIDFLIDRDTQTEIMVEKTDGTIQDLAASINHLLKKYRSMGQEIERSDTLFRDTITSLSHDLRTPLATANGYHPALTGTGFNRRAKRICDDCGRKNFRCKATSRPTV